MTDFRRHTSTPAPRGSLIPRSISAPWPLLSPVRFKPHSGGLSRPERFSLTESRSVSASRVSKSSHRGLSAALAGAAISDLRVSSQNASDSLVLPTLDTIATSAVDFGCGLDFDPFIASPTQCLSSLAISSTDEMIPPKQTAVHRALNCPEILTMILEAIDAENEIPHEQSQRRRKPMSLRHAQLIYGRNEKAAIEWEKARMLNPTGKTAELSHSAGMSSCLLVSRSWSLITRQIISKRLFFSNSGTWHAFVRQAASYNREDLKKMLVRKPKELVLHRISAAQQIELDHTSKVLGGALEWLELYTCPSLSPTADLLRGGTLKKIVLPGCIRVNDRTLSLITEHCPLLEHLDLRACEQVSDAGLKVIARYCPELTLLNVGRTRGGELVTYKGVKHLARQTKLSTLGIAGCAIDDRAVWELALNRGPSLLRLSLNNCLLLTDASVPRTMAYMPNLSVLELRGCTQITDMRPFVLFKRLREQQGHPPLIEGCEIIERRMQNAILLFRQELSRRVLADCAMWLNEPDSDTPFRSKSARKLTIPV